MRGVACRPARTASTRTRVCDAYGEGGGKDAVTLRQINERGPEIDAEFRLGDPVERGQDGIGWEGKLICKGGGFDQREQRQPLLVPLRNGRARL